MSELHEKDIDLIEKYLNHELPDEEEKAFKERMATDEEFKNQVETISQLRDGIRNAGRRELLNELKKQEEREPTILLKRTIGRNTWAMAVAAVLLLGLSVYLLWPAPQPNLFDQYFEPYPNIISPSTRGDLTADSTLLGKALQAYDMFDFEKAISILEVMESKQESELFYLGVSYLASSQPDKAIEIFERVQATGVMFRSQAEWYMALCYLKKKDREKAVQIFDNLKENEVYGARAEAILKELNP